MYVAHTTFIFYRKHSILLSHCCSFHSNMLTYTSMARTIFKYTHERIRRKRTHHDLMWQQQLKNKLMLASILHLSQVFIISVAFTFKANAMHKTNNFRSCRYGVLYISSILTKENVFHRSFEMQIASYNNHFYSKVNKSS